MKIIVMEPGVTPHCVGPIASDDTVVKEGSVMKIIVMESGVSQLC